MRPGQGPPWCQVCQQQTRAGRCACAVGPTVAPATTAPELTYDGVPTLRDRRRLLAAAGSRWRPSITTHGFWGRAAWSVLPVANLSFWISLGILQMPLALLVLGPIMLVPSLYALRVIWRYRPD